MNKPLHLIYVTGLGDNNPRGQRKAVSTWRWWGVEAELFQMKWADGEAWEFKFRRLLQRIDTLTTEGKNVALVGASAGAAAVINAFALRHDTIVGCVLIAGKVNRPKAIGNEYRSKNPAFVTAAYNCEKALTLIDDKARQHILSRYALADETVYKPDSRIPGARNHMVPSIGHFFTIATQITFGAPSFVHFLKQQAKNNL